MTIDRKFLFIDYIEDLKPMCIRNQIKPAPKMAYPIILLFALSFLLIGCQDQASQKASAMLEEKRLSEQASLKVKEREEQVRVLERQRCTVRRAEYEDLMAIHKYWEASLKLRGCSETMEDPVYKKLVIDAEIKSYLQDIKNPNTPPRKKAGAINRLLRICPEKGKKYETLVPHLFAKADKEDLAEQAAASRKGGGVSIGMSPKVASAQKVMALANQDCRIYEEGPHLVVEMRMYITDPNERLQYVRAIADADVILRGKPRNIYFYDPSNNKIAQADTLSGVRLY